MQNGDLIYKDKRSLRGKFTQQGAFPFQNVMRRPKLAQLRLFQRLRRQDVTIKSALTARTMLMLSTIGEIEHPDKEIAEFHNQNLKQLEETNGKAWQICLEQLQDTTYWAGFSVAEVLFDLKFGSLYLNDIVTYEPSSIMLYPDKKGRLVEGQKSFDHFHASGIWQMAMGAEMMEKQLPMWKCIHLVNDSDFGNHYGYSLIEPSYTWVRLKEALLDMMAAGLDKLGNRMLWVRMPSYVTKETRIDPATGEEEPMSTLQLVKEQFDASEGIPEVVFLPFQTADNKPEIGSEPLQDGIGEAFIQAIEYVDAQSIKHILPPYLLSTNMEAHSDPIIRERQMELFQNNLEADRSQLVSKLIKKVFMPIQQWNFNRESAKIPPTFSRVYSDRTEDRVATMQIIKGLVEAAVLNPGNDIDYTKIMQMLRLGVRQRDEKDMKFIHDMLIVPRSKPEPKDLGPKGAGSRGRSTGNKSKQISKKSPRKKAAT